MKYPIILSSLMILFLANAEPVSFRSVVNDDRIAIQCDSEIGKTYSIKRSSDLENFQIGLNQQATTPFNTWAIEFDLENKNKEFFSVIESDQNLVSNGDFSLDDNDWAVSINASANASVSTSDNNFYAAIINGGNPRHYIFLRQFNIPLVEGENYTLSFNASASNNRDILVLIQSAQTPSQRSLRTFINLTNESQNFVIPFTKTGANDDIQLSFMLGGSNEDVWIDDINITQGTTIGARSAAYEMNEKLQKGNNFMAARAIQNQFSIHDFNLLKDTGFTHCRYGYKLDEKVGSAPNYTIPYVDKQNIINAVNYAISTNMIIVVNPVHNWSNSGAFTGVESDYEKLGKIWEQVSDLLANYSKELVVFEVINEPHAGHDIARIINTSLASIRNSPGNEDRIVIVPGDGFSTRQALIDAFNNNEIPGDDDYLIGTFHYYDPRPYTKQGDPSEGTAGQTWGTDSEFIQVETDFDAVISANNSWAANNLTSPLPIYLGEFGVDNKSDEYNLDRKKWLSWVRMQAEKRNFSWAHWNMYNNEATSKGMGPWAWNYAQNPSTRTFDADPLEALVGFYRFKDGSRGGGVYNSQQYPDDSGNVYVDFPETTGLGVWARINSIYVPKNDVYKVIIRYSTELSRKLRLVYTLESGVVVNQDVLFPSTISYGVWNSLEIPINLPAGEGALKIVAVDEKGVALDWMWLTL